MEKNFIPKEDIFAVCADAWIGNTALTSELQNQFSFLIKELEERPNLRTLEELRKIFPEWEWESENGGFKKEITFVEAATRLYTWIGYGGATRSIPAPKNIVKTFATENPIQSTGAQKSAYDDNWETMYEDLKAQEANDLIAAVKLKIQITAAEKRLHDLELVYNLKKVQYDKTWKDDRSSCIHWRKNTLKARILDETVLQQELEKISQQEEQKYNARRKTEHRSLEMRKAAEKQSIEESLSQMTKQLEEYKRRDALFSQEVERLVNLFYKSKQLIVPKCDFKMLLGNIDSPLLESLLIKELQRDQLMNHNLLADHEEIFEERILKVLADEDAGGSPFNLLFQENFHWHNGKLLNASLLNDTEDRGKNQSFSKYMDKYADSLSVERAPEILEFSQNLRIYVEIYIEGDDIKEANFPQDLYDVTVLSGIKSMPDRQLRLRKELFSVLKNSNMSKQFKADTCIKMLAVSLSWGVDDCNKQPSAETVAVVFQIVHDLLINFKRFLSKHHAVCAYMAHTLDTLGFSPISKNLDVALNDNTLEVIRNANYSVLHKIAKAKDGREIYTKNCIDFQFMHLGENFVREIAPRFEDHKDVKFYPDQWQYDVIQRIKQDKSALIVAPTSTGKTFISFYTITRVLEKTKTEPKLKATESKMKARVVFVAPSTPLVNQMGANIYKRYKNENVSFGLFTSEFRENVENCDILISTPQILHVLLVSPSSQQWASKLQYIILDEIHCIGTQTDDSSLRSCYAKLLAFVPCPFLALSATVQNPTKLRSWLESVTSRDVALLPKEPIQPWNDVQRYRFVPPVDGNSCQLVKMNPIVLADTPERLQFLPSLHLRPEEVHEIWIALKQELGEDKLNHVIKSHDFFAQNGFIKRDDSHQFQQELFRVYTEEITTEQRQRVAKSLQLFPDHVGRIEIDNVKEVAPQFIELLQLMKKQSLLPSIAFCHKGQFIVNLVEEVVAQLDAMEPKKEFIELPKVEKDPGEIVEMSQKEFTKKLKSDAIEAKLQQVRLYSLNVSESCSFLAREFFSQDDVQYWVRRLFQKTGWSSRHPLILGLTRGIGSYTPALPKPYRDLVEALFRAGALTLIVGTPILSLGVNMPSKTTVFLRDSQYLSPLDAVQMAGRAGRRGFDNLGNVVYAYFSNPRVANLIYAPIQEFTTPNLLDISTTLNCFVLYSQTKDKPLAHSKISRLMTAPLSPIFTKEASQQAQLDASKSLRYCAEFLYRLKLIDDKARPIGLAGLVNHSFEISPYNYLLAFLIQSSALDHIVAVYNAVPSPTMTEEKIASDRSQGKDSLMTLLSYLILPRAITGHTQAKPAPNLLATIRVSILDYNAIVRRVNETVNNAYTRLGLGLVDPSLSPLVGILEDGECNGYAFNFYKNKKISILVKDNNISEYKAYLLLKQWDSILRKLTTALQRLTMDNVYDPLYTAFEEVTNEFHIAFKNISY